MAETSHSGAGHLDPSLAAAILENANDPIVLFDLAATITWANRAIGLLGWTASELVGRNGLELLEPHDVERALMAISEIDGGVAPPSSAPYEILATDGSRVECDVAAWLPGSLDALETFAVHIRPTHDSRVLRRLLTRLLAGDTAAVVLEDMLGLLYHRNDYAHVMVSFVDEDGVPRVVGDVLDPRLAGLDPGDDEGRVVEDLDVLPADVRDLAAAAGLGAAWITPVDSDDGDETLATISLWVREGGPHPQVDVYSVNLLRQLIELVLRWRRQTRELERAATRDPLTGLPNRRALAEFDHAGPRRDLGVLYIDLDRFKPVNDRFGHAAGDQVLRTVGNRLQSIVRPTDIVARLGGDEFGVVCPGCSRDELAELATQVHELLTEAIGVHGDIVNVGASIGVAIGHDSVEPLLARADRALYEAKEAGRGTIQWSAQ
jgi:diguanylate cyclase (GGDEF)-like protein/PAS domain S-box-containing protein